MNWTYAFRWADGDVSTAERRLVIKAIQQWDSTWMIESDNWYILSVQDSDGDDIWQYEMDDSEDVRSFFSARFCTYMDKKFNPAGLTGSLTKLPLPDASKPIIGINP